MGREGKSQKNLSCLLDQVVNATPCVGAGTTVLLVRSGHLKIGCRLATVSCSRYLQTEIGKVNREYIYRVDYILVRFYRGAGVAGR